MSKKPIWLMAAADPRVTSPGFYPFRECGRDFSRGL
jgi:hypothetical protein